MFPKRLMLVILTSCSLSLTACGNPPPQMVTGSPVPTTATKAAPPPSSAGAVAPANGDRFAETGVNRWTAAADQPLSTVSLDVSKSAYAIVRRYIREGRIPPNDAVRGDDMVNYFGYDYPRPQDKGRPFRITTTVAPSPWTKEAKLVHIALQGWDARQRERPRANITFLLDVSGSMSPPDRLPLIQQAIHQLVKGLNPDDTVTIVTYASGVGVALEPTAASHLDRIEAAVSALHADGNTAGGAGLQLAYVQAERNFDPRAVNRIILATDGDFNLGETNPRQLEEIVAAKRKAGIYLTVLGVGTDNLNDALMQRLAHAGNGQAAYIDSTLEAHKVFVEELGSTMVPIADDAKMQIEFNPAKVAEYRLVGYETRQLQRADFLDGRIAGGQVGAGHALTAIYEVLPVGAATHHVTPLRYQAPSSAPAAKASDEFGLVRVHYRLPGDNRSRIIGHPITEADARPTLAAAGNDVRFSVAVAGFAQLLRHDGAVADWSYEKAAALADGARGDDRHGWRSELIQLIRAAQGLVR